MYIPPNPVEICETTQSYNIHSRRTRRRRRTRLLLHVVGFHSPISMPKRIALSGPG
jgi:hypothetical protein